MKKVLALNSLAISGFLLMAFITPGTSTDSSFEGVITYTMKFGGDVPQSRCFWRARATPGG